MIPWVQLDTATVPGGGALRLMQRGTEFSIMAGATPLMNSRMSSSEVVLAELASERLRGRPNCRVLIGGYGMGFTLRAALAGFGADARIVVAELVPAVIAWARGPMAELTAGGLDDPRVSIHDGDVGGVIAAARGGFDAILLDVDNGPDGLSREENDRLYNRRGLEAARRALRSKGLLAIWSAAPNKAFMERLGHAGFAVEEIKARANKGRGVRHIIWAATNPAVRPPVDRERPRQDGHRGGRQTLRRT
jgi:spermidine synthase